eukprot:jgi/Astpho2/9941/Aster-06647
MAWFLQAVVCTVAALAALILFRRQRERSMYDVHKLPGPEGIPVLGNALQVRDATRWHQLYVQWVKQFGNIMCWRLGSTPMVVLSDPVDWVTLLSGKESPPLPKLTRMYQVIEVDAPKHFSMISTPSEAEWKHCRKTFNVAFSPAAMRKFWPIIHDKVYAALDCMAKVARQGVVDMDDIMSRLTAGKHRSLAFKQDYESLSIEQCSDGGYRFKENVFLQRIKAALEHASMAITNPIAAAVSNLTFWVPKNDVRNEKLMKEHDTRLLESVRGFGPQPEDNVDIWACASRLKDYRTGEPMNDGDLKANLSLFFAAGFETTAHSITFLLFELAHHPEKQAALAAELNEAGLLATPENPQPRHPELAELAKLPYLNAVIKEGLRMHPAAPLGSNRVLDRDTTIRGYRLPKGTPILFCPITLHYSPENWTRADEFLPERFLDGQGKHEMSDARHPDATLIGNKKDIPNSWSPFTLGPRACIGQAMGMLETRAAVAAMVAQYKLSPGPSMEDRQQWLADNQVFRITLQPKKELDLHITPRSKAS